jgi:protein-disulfide isomerase
MPDRRTLLIAAGAFAALGGRAGADQTLDDMSLGNPKARVRIVEYASLSCPHCAQFNAEVFPAFKAKYIDTGKVHYTLRELLTEPQQLAAAGFLMARCAGSDRYFSVVDQVFQSQANWGAGDIRGQFVAIAQKNGLDEARFTACLQDEAAVAALNARVRRAVEEDKIDSTPTFVINGVRLEGQVPTLAELDAAIAQAAKRGRR